jgi:SAM-dependent methyltransferase
MESPPDRLRAGAGNKKMKLLPRDLLIRTGPVDHADWNYKPVLGPISRRRFHLIRAMLKKRVPRLLEMGYGSGVFLPELVRYTDELYGADIHSFHREVEEQLTKVDLTAKLVAFDGKSLPFPDRFFSCIVAISVLEFIDDLNAFCSEIKRVLTPDGFLLVITPGASPLLDAGLRLLTGESAKNDFGDRRERLIPTLKRNFAVAEERHFGAPFLRLYTGLRLRPLEQVRMPEAA